MVRDELNVRTLDAEESCTSLISGMVMERFPIRLRVTYECVLGEDYVKGNTGDPSSSDWPDGVPPDVDCHGNEVKIEL